MWRIIGETNGSLFVEKAFGATFWRFLKISEKKGPGMKKSWKKVVLERPGPKKWLFLCFHEYLSLFHEKSAFFRHFLQKSDFFCHFHEKSDIFSHFLQKSDFFRVFMSNWVIRTKKGHFLGPDRNLPESIAGFWEVYQKVLRDSEKFIRKYCGILRSLPESIVGFWEVYQKVLWDSEKFMRWYLWIQCYSLSYCINLCVMIWYLLGFSAIHYRIV